MSYSNVLGCSMEIGRPSAFQNLVNVVRVLPCAVTQGLRPSHAYRRSMAGLPFVDELFGAGSANARSRNAIFARLP